MELGPERFPYVPPGWEHYTPSTPERTWWRFAWGDRQIEPTPGWVFRDRAGEYWVVARSGQGGDQSRRPEGALGPFHTFAEAQATYTLMFGGT